MKNKKLNLIREEQERKYWSKHDSTELINWKKAKKVIISKLKPSTITISIRLPEIILEELKMLANKKDVPYQSLLKIYLIEKIEEELKHKVA